MNQGQNKYELLTYYNLLITLNQQIRLIQLMLFHLIACWCVIRWSYTVPAVHFQGTEDQLILNTITH